MNQSIQKTQKTQKAVHALVGNSGSVQPRAHELTTVRPFCLALMIGFLVVPRPAAAACEREIDLATAVAHAGRGHVASQQDKFALARSQCGDVALGARDMPRDMPARESRQLSLYPTTATVGLDQPRGTPTPAAAIASPQARGRSRASSMASSSSPSLPSREHGQTRGSSGTTSPSIHGDRLDSRLTAPRLNPPFVPVRTPSKTTLRVQALADTMSRAATRYRLDPLLLHAIASVESNHDASARSSAGAIGVMQVMPDTARRFGVREPERALHDPSINIDVGAAYLSGLRSQYENNLPLMLAAYNAGEGAVERHGYRVPPYAETQNYVKRVLNMYDQLHRRTSRHTTRVRTTAHIEGPPVMVPVEDPAPALVRARDQAAL